MSAEDTRDRMIESWLADGPNRLSEAAVARIVGEIERTDARKPAWLRRRETLNRLVLSFGGVAVLVLVVIGAVYYFGPKTSGPGAGALYTSARHGFSLRIPTNWTTNQIAGSWILGTPFDYLGPGSDQFIDPQATAIERFMNSQPVTAGMTSNDWIAQYIRIQTQFFDNCRELRDSQTQVAGESARVMTFDCSGTDNGQEAGAELLVTHGGRGYVFRVINGPGDEQQLLLDWLATLEWTSVTQ